MPDRSPRPISDIKPKMKVDGTIVRIELAGARVDIGAEHDAFLHISQIRAGRPVTRVADVLKEGEPITVWVKQVNPQQNLIALTMYEPPALEWGDLQRRMKLSGRVVRVEDFGAFVSIGAPKDGLVPAGHMAKTRIHKPSDIVSEGDEVTVWVTHVNRKENKIGLSMVEPPAVDWNDLQRGQIVGGKVTRLEKFGAFVDIGAEREAMIHVSEITTGYISHPSDLLRVGEEVEAQVLDFDPRRKQIKLSIKALERQTPGEEEPEPALLTPMEVAFQQAQVGAKAASRPATQRTADERSRDEQEEIFRRTIEQHTAKS